MTKRTFRLTYINARRPIGVAGCEYPSADDRMKNIRKPRSALRSLTEASRAIHESKHESHTNERGPSDPRDDGHIVVFRGQRHWNELSLFGRPLGRRESHRLGYGVPPLELDCGGRYHDRDINAARLARPYSAESGRYLEHQR